MEANGKPRRDARPAGAVPHPAGARPAEGSPRAPRAAPGAATPARSTVKTGSTAPDESRPARGPSRTTPSAMPFPRTVPTAKPATAEPPAKLSGGGKEIDARVALMFEREAMDRAAEQARGRRILITIAGFFIAAIVLPILWSSFTGKSGNGSAGKAPAGALKTPQPMKAP